MNQCPFCSSRIQEGLSTCPYCNENLLRHAAPAPAPTLQPDQSPAGPPPTVKPDSPADTRRCPHCAEQIGAADTVCRYCGLAPSSPPPPPEKRPCPFCAEPIATTDRTCRYCGHAVGPAPPPAEPSQPRPCPFCAKMITTTDRTCRYCGRAIAQRPRPGVRVFEPQGKFIEWEQPDRGLFSRWWSTWAGTQFGSDRFWSRVPWSGGAGPPLKFAAFLWIQLMALVAMCAVPLLALSIRSGSRTGANEGPMMFGAILGIVLLLIPVGILLALVVTYVWAGIYHVSVMLFGGRQPFEVTLRAVAYSSGTYVWGILNIFFYVGSLLQLIFGMIALTNAFHYGHRMSKARAFMAAFLPVVLFCGATVGSIVFTLLR